MPKINKVTIVVLSNSNNLLILCPPLTHKVVQLLNTEGHLTSLQKLGFKRERQRQERQDTTWVSSIHHPPIYYSPQFCQGIFLLPPSYCEHFQTQRNLGERQHTFTCTRMSRHGTHAHTCSSTQVHAIFSSNHLRVTNANTKFSQPPVTWVIYLLTIH